jgi:hypothetical protein
MLLLIVCFTEIRYLKARLKVLCFDEICISVCKLCGKVDAKKVIEARCSG